MTVNLQDLYMRLTFVCLCLSTVSSMQTPSDVLWRRIIDDVYQAAPFNSFCNRTEPIVDKIFSSSTYPCMLQCSCDNSTCWDKLPCCPDIPEPRTERRRISSCLYPVIYSEPFNVFNHPQNHADFPIRMIHDCGHEYIGSETHEKCQLFRNTSDLEHMVPVVSNVTGIVYANRFCAECSGTTHYQTFTAHFKCWNRLFGFDKWELLALEWNEENRIKLIEAGMCNYIFEAPNKDVMENNKCMQVRYTYCNESGKWDFKDPFLEDACEAYELPYRDVYRNYHCMLCNTHSSYASGETRHRINPVCLIIKLSILKISFYSLISLDRNQLIGIDMPKSELDNQECKNEPHVVYDRQTVS